MLAWWLPNDPQMPGLLTRTRYRPAVNPVMRSALSLSPSAPATCTAPRIAFSNSSPSAFRSHQTIHWASSAFTRSATHFTRSPNVCLRAVRFSASVPAGTANRRPVCGAESTECSTMWMGGRSYPAGASNPMSRGCRMTIAHDATHRQKSSSAYPFSRHFDVSELS